MVTPSEQRRLSLLGASLLLEALWVAGLAQVARAPEMQAVGSGWFLLAALLLYALNRFIAEVAGLDDARRPRMALLASVATILLIAQLGLRDQIGWFTPGRLVALLGGPGEAGSLQTQLLLATLGLLGLLWWRTLTLHNEGVGIRATVGRFRLALVALAVAALIGGLLGIPAPVTALVTAVLVGLAAISLARAESVATTYGEALPFSRRSLGIVGGTLAVALGAALLLVLLAGLVWPVMATPLTTIVVALLDLFLRVVLWLVTPLAWLIVALIDLLVGEGSMAQVIEQLQVGQPNQEEMVPPELITLPPLLTGLVRLGTTVLVLTLLAWIISRTITRRGRQQSLREAGRSSVYTQGQLGQDLAGWLRQTADALAAQVGRLRGRPYNTASVRELYKNMLQLGATLGVPRPLEATPTEYQALLAARLPDYATNIAALTTAYIVAHYGAHDPPPAEMVRLQAQWERLAEAERQSEPTAAVG